MKANFEATNAHQIEFSMTIVMTLDQWKRLKERLSAAWPASELSRVISDMVIQAERNFHPQTENKP